MTSNTRLTVLQMIPNLESGGVERGTLETAAELVRRGHRSLVMSGGGRMVADLTRRGSEHFQWPVGKKSPTTLRLVTRLRRFLIDNQVDVLHVRSRVPAWLAWVAWRGLPPESRPRLVSTFHGFYSINRYSRIMTSGERVIAVSRSVQDYISDSFPDVDATTLRLIPRGVDPTEFPFGFQADSNWREQWEHDFPQLRDRFVVTLPGRITRLKGHFDLLEIVGQLVAAGIPIHALVVGEEDRRRRAYANSIRSAVRTQKLTEHVTFVGHRTDMREIYSVSNAVVSLSRKPESFGRTVLEALRLGRPVIGYDHGGVGEILSAVYDEGRISVGNTAQAAQKLADLAGGTLDGPQPFNRFTLSDMLDGIMDVYTDLAGNRALPVAA